jgi:energy-coupling factor transporter ATP-binding protein EcfA2
VDETSRGEFYELLKKLNQDLGITLILISHDMEIVTREVTEVAVIDRGLTYYHAKPFPI